MIASAQNNRFGRWAACVVACVSISSLGFGQESTPRVVQAADKFLATLSESQRREVVYAYNDAGQRARWSNLPTGFLRRGGISLKEMSPAQKAAALDLLKTVLSPMGYEKVSEIRMADDDFKANGSNRGTRGGGGGPPPVGPGRAPFNRGDMFGSDLYYISFVGKPSTSAAWMLQFGGHHLALNITIVADKNIMTPSLTGAQPATFKVDGKTVRPLGRESDKALALLQSLDTQQRSEALLKYQVADLVLGPGQDGRRITPEGLKASAMNDKQKVALVDLIAEWAGIVNDAAASARMAQIRADIKETWFAWSGSTTSTPGTNITAYYRIQGPHLVIEYASQRDEPANHVHTIYRDPTDDYGGRSTAGQ